MPFTSEMPLFFLATDTGQPIHADKDVHGNGRLFRRTTKTDCDGNGG